MRPSHKVTLVAFTVMVAAMFMDGLSSPAAQAAGSAAARAAVIAKPAGLNESRDAVWARVGRTVQSVQASLENLPGFAGLKFDFPEDQGFTLYWKGDLPAAAERVIAALPANIPAHTLAAQYSSAALLAEGQRLAGTRAGEGGPLITTSSPRVDGSGIDVEVDLSGASPTWAVAHQLTPTAGPGAVTGAIASSSARAALSAAQAAVASVIPIAVVGDARPRVTAREGDTSPFYGGATIRNVSNQNLCSTGWRMKAPTGAYRMVTAFHCNAMSSVSSRFNTYKYGDSGAGTYLGSSTNGWKAPYDFMVLWNASYGSSIYDGAWDSANSVQVTGSESAVVGEPLCQSGGFSGVVCDAIVRSVTDTVTYAAPVGKITPLIRTEQSNGVASVGEGDSGSPAYVTSASGVHVVGMMEGADFGSASIRACNAPVQQWIGVRCSKRTYLESARLIESQFGYTTG